MSKSLMDPSTPSANVDDWDEHWSRFGRAAEIGPTPRYRRRLIFRLLDLPKQGHPAVIEFGSGTGELAEALLLKFPHCGYTGLEYSLVGVQESRKRVAGATFLQRDLLCPDSDPELPANFATHAICTEVLEHLDDPVLFLRHATRYMAAGCLFVATVPGGPLTEFYRVIGHRRHYHPRELASLMEQAGLHVERTYAAGFPFFNLFRLALVARGSHVADDVSGEPGVLVRAGSKLFDLLLPLSLMHWGWQTIAVGRWLG